MRIPLMRYIAWYLIMTMFAISIVPRLEAGMVRSEIIVSSQINRVADIEKIQRVLEMKVVKNRLQGFGFTTDEIKTRLDKLSDQQIHQLALQIDELRVGTDSALGVVIALLLIVLIVVLILHITGYKVIVRK